MTAKVFDLNVPSAMAELLTRRVSEIAANPERGECFFCQCKRDACVCGQEWFQAARIIAVHEGKREEWTAILSLMTSALVDMQDADADFDPFEDAIDMWHERDGLNEAGQSVQLHEWLNLTRREFALYMQCSELAPYLHVISRIRAKAHREQIDDTGVRNGAGSRLGAESP